MAAVWTAVPRTVATLRDQTVVEFDRDRVKRIDLESPKGTLTLAKDGDKWRISARRRCPPTRSRRARIFSSSGS